MKKNKKEDKYLAVSQAILHVIHVDGLSKLNLSKVAQKSKVSRAWIYQYMGKNRADLMEIAAEACSSFFVRSHIEAKLHTTRELRQQLAEGAEFSIRAGLEHPILVHMYFSFRGHANALGTAIRKYEQFWLKHFSQHFQQVLKIPENKATAIAETVLILRLGFAHQLITSSPLEKKLSEVIQRVILLQEQVIGIQQKDLVVTGSGLIGD